MNVDVFIGKMNDHINKTITDSTEGNSTMGVITSFSDDVDKPIESSTSVNYNDFNFGDDDDDFISDSYDDDDDDDFAENIIEDDDDFVDDFVDDFADDVKEPSTISSSDENSKIEEKIIVSSNVETDNQAVDYNIISVTIPISEASDVSSIYDEFELWIKKEFVNDVIEEWEDRFGAVDSMDDVFKHWLLIKYNITFVYNEIELDTIKRLTCSDMRALSPAVFPLTKALMDEMLQNRELLNTEKTRTCYQMLRKIKLSSDVVIELIQKPDFMKFFYNYVNQGVAVVGAFVKIFGNGEFAEDEFNAVIPSNPASVSEFLESYYGENKGVLQEFAGEDPQVMKLLLQLFEMKEAGYEMPIAFKGHKHLIEVVRARLYNTEDKVAEEFIYQGAPDWFAEGYASGKFCNLEPVTDLYLAIANTDCKKFGLQPLRDIEHWVVDNYYLNYGLLSEYKQLLLFKSLGVDITAAEGVRNVTEFLLNKFILYLKSDIQIPRDISRMILLLSGGKMRFLEAEQVIEDVDFIRTCLDSDKLYTLQMTRDNSMLIIVEEGMENAVQRIAGMSCITSSSVEQWAKSDEIFDPFKFNALNLCTKYNVNMTGISEMPASKYSTIDRCFDYMYSIMPEVIPMFQCLPAAQLLKIVLPVISVKNKMKFAIHFVSRYFTEVENTVEDYSELNSSYVQVSILGVPASMAKFDEFYRILKDVDRSLKCKILTKDGMIYFRVG